MARFGRRALFPLVDSRAFIEWPAGEDVVPLAGESGRRAGQLAGIGANQLLQGRHDARSPACRTSTGGSSRPSTATTNAASDMER